MDQQAADIRYSELNDEQYLVNWLQQPENLQWFPMSEEDVAVSAKNWVGFSKFFASLTATVNNEPVGIATIFLMPYRKVAHNASFYLVVDKNNTKRGVGTLLLRNIANLAQNYFRLESIFAEVYEGSPLIPILQKNNFHNFASQPHFVKEKGIYRKRLLFDTNFKEEKSHG